MSEPKYTLDRDKNGLTSNQRDVLAAISIPKTLSYEKIGNALGVNKQRVNQIVQDLEAKGFITKKEVYVRTPKGAKSLEPTKIQ